MSIYRTSICITAAALFALSGCATQNPAPPSTPAPAAPPPKGKGKRGVQNLPPPAATPPLDKRGKPIVQSTSPPVDRRGKPIAQSTPPLLARRGRPVAQVTPGPLKAPPAAPVVKPRAGRYVVTAKKSPFYRYGPAQAFGPDFALQVGQRVTVTNRSFGFSRVMTDDGIEGYMPTDDLAPAPLEVYGAPPPQFPARRTRGDTASGRNPGGAEQFYSGPVRKSAPPERLEGAPPLFDVYDVPLPSDPVKSSPEKKSAHGKAAAATPTPAPASDSE